MNINNILSTIDSELSLLKQARALLAGIDGSKSSSPQPVKTKRTLSAAARKKIAAAQRKRWAAVKKAAE